MKRSDRAFNQASDFLWVCDAAGEQMRQGAILGGWGIDWSPAYGPDEEAKMSTDREIALENVIAALLKAARHDKNEILERAKGLVVDGAIGGFHSKTSSQFCYQRDFRVLRPIFIRRASDFISH